MQQATYSLPPPPPPPLPPCGGSSRGWPACCPSHMHPPQAESWDVEHKADDSPLTRADREANAVICEGLARIGAPP